jgi:hypothetical protein
MPIPGRKTLLKHSDHGSRDLLLPPGSGKRDGTLGIKIVPEDLLRMPDPGELPRAEDRPRSHRGKPAEESEGSENRDGPPSNPWENRSHF